jgi:glutathione S-transferase
MFASVLRRSLLRARPLAAASATAATAAAATLATSTAENAGWFGSPKIHLKYFAVQVHIEWGGMRALSACKTVLISFVSLICQGAAETIRYTMALAGAEWTETSWVVDFKKFSGPASLPVACPPYAAAKDAGELDANMGRVPVIIIDGKHELGQSKSIERFLARRLGVMGSGEIEAAQIDMFTENIRDVKDKYQKAKGEKDKEAAVKEYFEKTMPEFMEKLEKSLPKKASGGANGALVGTSLSLADVTLFVFIKDFFDNKAGALGSIDACPRLKASVSATGKHPNIVKYIAKRSTVAT